MISKCDLENISYEDKESSDNGSTKESKESCDDVGKKEDLESNSNEGKKSPKTLDCNDSKCDDVEYFSSEEEDL